jgi:hypothetical protein
MDTEVLSAVIGAAMGAAFTYGGTLLQQNRDRRRIQQSSATMLLSELQTADATLRTIYEQPMGGTLPAEEFPLLRSPSTEMLGRFSHVTIQQLLTFAGYLRMTREMLDRIKGSPRTEVGWHAGVATAIAGQAVLMVPDLKSSLEREGGSYLPLTIPNAPVLNPGNPEPPALPPSPFPTRRRTDVTTSPVQIV